MTQNTESQITIHDAKIADAVRIHQLITFWASRTPVLGKSLGQVYETLREFVVAKIDGEIVGAAALHIDWADLAEIRSVVVDEKYLKAGVGKKVIYRQCEIAKELGVEKVFVLTDKVDYFEKLGFKPIDKNDLPHKVWRDCIHCPIFANCTEVPLGMDVQVNQMSI